MKIYINGGGFGSNIPLQGGSGTYSNKILTAASSTGEYLCTIATDYTISGNTNYGGTFSEGYNSSPLLAAGTFNLRLGDSEAFGDIIASNIDASDFVDQVIVDDENDCIVYIPGYLELIPYTSFVLNQYNPLIVTTGGSFKIKSDSDWTLTGPSFLNLGQESGTAGETEVYFAIAGSGSGIFTLTNESATRNIYIKYDTASIISVDSPTVIVDSNATTATFSGSITNPTIKRGSVDESVTIDYTGTKPDWIGSLSDFRTVNLVDDVLYFTLTFPISENTGATRAFNFNILYDSYGQKAKYAGLVLSQSGIDYSIELNKTTINTDYNATTDSITVTYDGTGTLSVSSTEDWCTVSLTNNTVNISIAENVWADSRSSTITVTDGVTSANCYVTQTGKTQPTGSITVNKPTNFTISNTGGSIDLDWIASGDSAGLTITTLASSSSSWITVTETELSSTEANYTLNPTGSITFQANTGEQRTGSIKLTINATGSPIVSKTLTFTQLAADSLTINPTSSNVPKESGSFEVTINYTGSGTLTRSVDSDWLTFTGNTISYSENTTVNERTGTATISDGTLSAECIITQSGSSVYLTIDPTTLNVDNNQNTGTISVSYNGEGTLTVNKSSWITATLTNKTINYTISSNTGSARNGYIIVTDGTLSATCSINQSASTATISVNPSELNVYHLGDSTDVTVTYTGTTEPTFTSDSWITVTKKSSSVYSIAYADNYTEQTRTGKVTFSITGASTELTVNQTTGSAGLYLSPQSLSTDHQARSGTIDIIYSLSGDLTINNPTSWITASISGTVINYSLTENTTGSERIGRFWVTNGTADTMWVVSQKAKSTAKLTLTPSSFNLTNTGQSGTIAVSYTGSKSLSDSSDSGWLAVSQISNTSITFNVLANTGSERTGTLTITDGDISAKATITQAGKTSGTLKVANSTQSVSASGGIVTNTIIPTGDVGTISVYSNSITWCTVSFSGYTISANCLTNTGDSRTALITVSGTNAASVTYTITQSAAEQKYIYFDSNSKSIGYSGGSITNTLRTNGTTPTYSSNQSWATVDSSGTVTVSYNSGSSRSATITASNSIGTASYIIYQTSYSSVIPIWKNTIYSEVVSGEYIEYHIDDVSGTVLYAGKVYKYPNSNSVEFCVNDAISNYLTIMPFPETDGNTLYDTWQQSFSLVTSSGNSDSYTFNNDWSYEGTLQQINPISNIVDSNQLFVCSGTNTYFTIGSTRYTVNGTYRLDLSKLLLPCDTKIKVYNNNSLIWTYSVDDTNKEYVIYWANKYGGWDFLPIKGNTVRTDNIESNKYTKIQNYTLYDTKYLNTIKPSWKLYSGWLKGNLSDLISSIDVKLYDLKTKKLYNVVITDSQAEYKNYKNNGNHLVSYEINCEMSNDYTRK